jgi:VWFA-related protein
MNKIFACLAMILFLCGITGISAQETERPAEQGAENGKARFEVATTELGVRAIVTDKNGRIVEDLKQEDFELLENDIPQEITHFDISKVENVRSPAAAEEGESRTKESKLEQARAQLSKPPVRTILLYVDTQNLSFSSLNWVKRALQRFIDEQLTDQDLVALASSETLGVAQQFTRDRKILKYAAEQIQYNPTNFYSSLTPNIAAGVIDDRMDAMRMAVDVVRREESVFCPCSMLRQLAFEKASRVLLEASYARENTLLIINYFARQMADLPGKRMIVVFSDGFTLYDRSGNRQDDGLHEAISRAVVSGVAIYSIDAKGLAASVTLDAARKGPTLESPVDDLLVQCLDECEATYASNSSSADPTANATAWDQFAQCSEQCQAKYPTAFMCPDEAFDPDPVCDFPGPGELDTYIESSEIEKMNGLNSLAVETGGKMYDQTNDLNEALGEALDDNRFFYVLSYNLTAGKDDDSLHCIEVRVRDHPEYTVRSQRCFRPSALRENLDDINPKTPQERLIRAMRSPLPLTDLGVSTRVDFLETEDDDKQVSLTVYFEGDRLQYREQEQGGIVELEVMSFIYDSSGDQVEGISASVEGRFTSEDMMKARNCGFRLFLRRLSLEPGVYQVRVGAREEGTDRMGTATTWLEVPEQNPDKLEMSSLILSNPLDMDLVDSEGTDVGELEQVKIVQGVPMYAPTDIFYYTFRVHRISQVAAGSDLLLRRELYQWGSPIRTDEWVQIEREQANADSKGWFDIDGELDISNLDPGVYEMRITLKNAPSEETVQRAVVFGIL